MSSFVIPAFVAVLVGCGLAVLAFVPFVAISYRRRGGLTLWHAFVWLAAAVYAMALWTYTLLPVPPADEVTCAAVQLRPFQFVSDILSFDTGSVRALMTNPAVLQVALNVVLFVPLGWFVRQLAGRGIIVATITGLTASALIELTQLTGIWGVYPCAYRVFDVDDLIINTLGAVLGSLASLLLLRRRKDLADAAAPQPITVTRRLTGIVCDLLVWGLFGWTVSIVFMAFTALLGDGTITEPDPIVVFIGFALPFVAQLYSVLSRGVTLGERLVLIAAVQVRRPVLLGRSLRFLFGIGGYMLLSQWTFPLSGLLLFALVAASAVMVFTTRRHRGLACVVSGTEIDDVRTRDTVAPGEVGR
ncbi:VanZ family protein [Brevibacterium sp. SMBL_HHYL_HB1]|jgi:glycopeptide antibiotics resistance protein|uniref:VanZ family protein n=1 Tax=Brevibacterium sp. SMBL_HHYL_HB1 TaxID=2777556 RepID=UPI001BAA9D31|nr:VanZ family protein [Brevibacterium sp. SMBL_HHYL_HB1]QUL78771.1 VanZ family protein [Brevibacterium sp. SMBL_HHYL_HB1]